jgi:DNA polymerase-3 subunit delta'
VLASARSFGTAAKETVETALAEELDYLPKKEHRKRTTEFTERARRAERRAATGGLDQALVLMGLWYRDLACGVAGAPELVPHSDRLEDLQKDAEGRKGADLDHAVELVDDTRARLTLNVDERLACEALVYRLERTFSRN